MKTYEDMAIIRTYSMKAAHLEMVDKMCQMTGKTQSQLIRDAIEQMYARMIQEQNVAAARR